MDTLWGCDAYGRLNPPPLVAVAVADDGQAVRFGPNVPSDLRQQLELVRDRFTASDLEGQPPPTLEKYRELLASVGSVDCHSGPSYIFPIEALSSPPVLPSLRIFISDEKVPSTLEEARPEAWWELQEWTDLLSGRLGPWAIGMTGDRIVTLCHTPVASSTAAEAGVWTHPEERGKGYAPVITAAWARVAGRRFDTLFYSTAAHNIASQTVARKLQLRPIGSIWQLQKKDAGTVFNPEPLKGITN